MESIVYEKIFKAAQLLNEVIGYVDSQADINSLKRKMFQLHIHNKIINCSDCSPVKKEITVKNYKYKGITISMRTDGRWYTRIQRKGLIKNIYGNSVDEVKKKCREVLLAFSQPEEKGPQYTFFQWLEFWNNTYKKPYNRTDSITAQINKHIFQKMKDKPLERVGTLELQLLVNNITSTRTRLAVVNILKAALRIAVKTKVIKENPAEALVKVVHVVKKGEALSRAEESAFFKAIMGHRMEKLFLFYLYSGCRRSEALELGPADVDFAEKTIKIHGTKTTGSDREIPLFNKIADILQSIEPENGRYFPFNEDSVTQSFKKLCPLHKLHDLRHTFATRCLEAGIAMKTVQVWLGHSTFEMTANTYSHAQKDFQIKEALRLNSYFDTVFDTVSETLIPLETP